MMRKIKKWIVAVALIMATTVLKAQETSPVSFMRLNPYQTNTNVATDLPYYAYFSPGVGNFSMNVQYSTFGIIDLL